VVKELNSPTSKEFWCKPTPEGDFQCTICDKRFPRKDNLKRHVRDKTKECRKRWDGKKGAEQWGIIYGTAAEDQIHLDGYTSGREVHKG
jgi:hypothetical protein